jgi:WD40 repeat protein
MKKIFRKSLVCTIIVLFIGFSIVPTISGTINKSYTSSPIDGGDPDILWEVEGHTRSVYGVAFSHDGLTVASGAYSPDSTAKLWQADDGTLLHTYPDNDDGILSVDISSDNEFLAAGYIVTGYPPGGKMNLWDISEEVVVNDFGGCYVSFSQDGEFIASGGGGANRYLFVHRVSNGEEMWYSYTGAYISDVKYSPDGQFVASSGSDNKIKLWDAQTGDLIRTFSGHTNDVSCIAFSPDSQMIASGTGGFDASEESNIKLWQVSDGSLIRTLEGHGDWVYDVDFVPDGEYLVSSGREDTSPLIQKIKFWRVSSGDIYLEYDEQALNIAYSPLGDLFVYGKSSGYVVVANSPILPENRPPGKPDINGPDMGVPGTEYIYILSAEDPDNDELFYYVDWDDGTYDDWFGPFASGTDAIASHIWNEKGEYTIKVKAKDTFGHESDWATLPVTMPRNRLLTSPFFMRLLERFPNAFPILRHLMGL